MFFGVILNCTGKFFIYILGLIFSQPIEYDIGVKNKNKTLIITLIIVRNQ